ncbi:MAG: alpha/beta fold hydrolase [Blastocatellia bacterium]
MNTIRRRNFLKGSVAAAIAGLTMGKTVDGHQSDESLIATQAPQPFIRATDGTSLYFKDWGRGRTLVFLHSWALNSDVWQYQMTELTVKGFRCVAFDRRGHGRSSQPWDGYDFDTLASDLNSIIERLNLKDVILAAHSMACGEVIRYLTKFGPNRVSKIVLVSPTTPFILKTNDNPEGIDRSLLERFRLALQRDVPQTLALGMPGFFGDEPNLSPKLMEWAFEQTNKASLRALIECNRINTETDFRGDLEKVRVPTLILHGDSDVSSPLALTGQRTAKLIPNASLIVYKGGPHGIILTHKDKMTSDILTFAKAN